MLVKHVIVNGSPECPTSLIAMQPEDTIWINITHHRSHRSRPTIFDFHNIDNYNQLWRVKGTDRKANRTFPPFVDETQRANGGSDAAAMTIEFRPPRLFYVVQRILPPYGRMNQRAEGRLKPYPAAYFLAAWHVHLFLLLTCESSICGRKMKRRSGDTEEIPSNTGQTTRVYKEESRPWPDSTKPLYCRREHNNGTLKHCERHRLNILNFVHARRWLVRSLEGIPEEEVVTCQEVACGSLGKMARGGDPPPISTPHSINIHSHARHSTPVAYLIDYCLAISGVTSAFSSLTANISA
ncbi:hypothetical protein NA57DRAFT_59052 [Rhizodiscina lignyota]|uniref:Uncharacterized protein n=1 Tax=Rhizodiscina lignyota TaxID=1504668 RepID=A0A9P4IA92_9PEZI|nr:hypothetical protein NA57DRAFT_59052 [Rhizodiscina lignyota]